jgi:hypothetical protein
MKISSLISKLTKINVPFTILEGNGYNKDIEFSINGSKFEASFTEGYPNIQYYSKATGYDDASQVTTCFYFDNFAQLLRHASK